MKPNKEVERLSENDVNTINAVEALNVTNLATAFYRMYQDSQEEFRIYAKENNLSHITVRAELEKMVTEFSREVAYYKALTLMLKNKLRIFKHIKKL